MTVVISDEVRTALDGGAPVVALESTIVTHGMDWPVNVETALAVESDVRKGGAVPATIAVVGGNLRVGLDADELTWLAQAKDVAKLSRADLAIRMAGGGNGSTTVAATMLAARLAGIEVFATGGIGGVHRGALQSWDVSADLQELARTAVTVVCAGPKAILDLPLTLEVLETLGVPVIAYGQDQLPAFWSREIGLRAPFRLDHAEAIARSHRMRRALGIDGGQLVCNPIPADYDIPAAELTGHIEAATSQAEEQRVAAKDVTPFLLARMAESTDGAAVRANVALIRNNAVLAAEIASALAHLPR